jgi:hypothetical protein
LSDSFPLSPPRPAPPAPPLLAFAAPSPPQHLPLPHISRHTPYVALEPTAQDARRLTAEKLKLSQQLSALQDAQAEALGEGATQLQVAKRARLPPAAATSAAAPAAAAAAALVRGCAHWAGVPSAAMCLVRGCAYRC